MFKKSLTALAVLSTMTGYAVAGQVTLYGVVDEGLNYTKEDVKVNGVRHVDEHTFGLDSGLNAASRIGLTGQEALGNGMTVGFKLENGFKADTGALGDKNRLFDREASLTVTSPFGRLSAGRMGGVASAAGSYDIVYAIGDAFDGGDNKIFGLAKSARYDNILTYQTPVMGGLQATVQYSFKKNSTDPNRLDAREGSKNANRYTSAALTGSYGPFNAVLAYELQDYGSNYAASKMPSKDGQAIYLGGNYDFGVAKAFAMAQYFKGQEAIDAMTAIDSAKPVNPTAGFKGYGLHLGTIVPVCAGHLTIGGYYVDGQAEFEKTADRDNDYIGIATKYVYPLSRRTSLYAGAGYAHAKLDGDATDKGDTKANVTQAYMGVTHKF
ncbi:MAG: porin [Sutterella wadsworthensis]|nr:porin [Sutterella wadsworthensis]